MDAACSLVPPEISASQLHSFLPFHPSLWDSKSCSYNQAEAGSRAGVGRKLARLGKLVSLFPENECNFHSFLGKLGPVRSRSQGVALVSNGPSNGSALGLYLMPQR